MDTPTRLEPETRRFALISWPGLAAVLLALSAFVLFGVGTSLPELRGFGYVPMAASLIVAWIADRNFARDLSVIAGCLGLISSISVEADIS